MKMLITIIISMLVSFNGQNHNAWVNGVVLDDVGMPLPGVTILEKGTQNGTVSDLDGYYSIAVADEKSVLHFSFIGYEVKEVQVGNQKTIDVKMTARAMEQLEEVVVSGYGQKSGIFKRLATPSARSQGVKASVQMDYEMDVDWNTEEYATIHENGFRKPKDHPLSTFSIDVDAASYSNMRRFINYGQRPPKDAIRIEELINYFDYDYPQPSGDHPFSITTEVARAPWNKDHYLVHVGLQGEEIATEELPASNLVFLIDVSGSMQNHNKLPLLKSSLKMLTHELRPQDRVSIVVYAGAAGLVLPPTSGDQKSSILKALDKLEAGGSTAGGAGIELAYQTARQHFVDGGNNRVILATDGDFNVGSSSNAAMERLIEKKREEGIFLTVLGYGMGNYKDSKMETLADKGNGNYAYIDNIMEARKVLVNEFGGTLFTIAKDVKIQVEFNPAIVQAYRLIGYENRKLNAEDFNDDKKDAGELGSGHSVTALYEVIPVGIESSHLKAVDDLKYQQANVIENASDELLTIKFRYKTPDGTTSRLITQTLDHQLKNDLSMNMQWSAAVAGFGMLIRESEYSESMNWKDVKMLANNAIGVDRYGYRKEFLKLVDVVEKLD
ncbi:MAG: von Willebrand factor type A domain-containing protein [Cyclobacteriaceae bacterium]